MGLKLEDTFLEGELISYRNRIEKHKNEIIKMYKKEQSYFSNEDFFEL